MTQQTLEQMNIVIVGHVDHGKSSVIGRLLADTNTLPQGRIEQIKAFCKANSRPFEYAFLLDALKDEQAQGITIDSARSFFKTKKRHYIIIDAPGHIEFLKNMISGAARAESALLVIDAKEGIQENSKRHGYMLSLLGIKNVIVLINKMDLVDYREAVFSTIQSDYTQFLAQFNVKPVTYIPISALQGDCIAQHSPQMSWYQGKTVLEQMDSLTKKTENRNQSFRMPVQDIYRFTEEGDDRRIIAGTVDSGTIQVNDKVKFSPSGKISEIKSIEHFNVNTQNIVYPRQSIGFTLKSQIYIQPGEIMSLASDQSVEISNQFKVNIFWMGKRPMVKSRNYKLKLASHRCQVTLKEIIRVLDSSSLDPVTKQKIEKNDVAEVILETIKPIAFDLATHFENTGRLIIVDQYEIAGGGLVIENLGIQDFKFSYANQKDKWQYSTISQRERSEKYQHRPATILIKGNDAEVVQSFATKLEQELFNQNYKAYCVQFNNKDNNTAITRLVKSDALEDFSFMMITAHKMGLLFIGIILELQEEHLHYFQENLNNSSIEQKVLVINVGEYCGYAQINLPSSDNNSVTEVISFLKEQKTLF